jgi:hypothetical protein
MSSADPRLQYIAHLASTALDLDQQHAEFEKWPGLVQKSVLDFVNDYSKRSLHLYKTEEGLKTSSEKGDEAIYLLKRHPGVEIPSHHVHRYILSTTYQGSDALKLLLEHLHHDNSEPEPEHSVVTIDDEIRYWKKQTHLPVSDLYLPHLQALNDRLTTKWQSEEEIQTALEDVELILGDLLREDQGSFPQSRMSILMQSCSGHIVSYIQERLSDADLFTGPWQVQRHHLACSQRIIDLWQLILQDLQQRDLADRWHGEWVCHLPIRSVSNNDAFLD